MGQSILKHRRRPFRSGVGYVAVCCFGSMLSGYRRLLVYSRRTCWKGIGLIFPNLTAEIGCSLGCTGLALVSVGATRCGNANELGYADWSPGKSCLFFIKSRLHGIGSARDMEMASEKHRASCDVRCAPSGPWKSEGENDFRVRSYPYPQQVSKVKSLSSTRSM